MADHAIGFSAPMIRALLEGRKTMTRRLAWRDRRVRLRDAGDLIRRTGPSRWQKLQPGDRLWVREAVAIHVGGRNLGEDDAVLYRADFAAGDNCGGPWRTERFMPRRVSRLTLTVTAVRVEQLRAITEADAEAEGMINLGGRGVPDCWWHSHDGLSRAGTTAPAAFGMLWDDLHGPGAWDANPEVVAITFTVQKGNIDAA